MATSNMVKMWYIAECPWKDECSKPSWSKTRSCASYESAEESRQFLLKHLKTSGHHWATCEEELLTCVANTPVLTDLVKKRFRPSQYKAEEGVEASAAKRGKTEATSEAASFSATAEAVAALAVCWRREQFVELGRGDCASRAVAAHHGHR